jgi:hypothetical protein
MPITREHELWGLALWVEKNHGPGGWLYIAQQQDRLLAVGDSKGVAMWREGADRFDQLAEQVSSN